MRKLLSDASFTGISHLISALAQIGLQIYVVRTTSPQAFGEYTVAFAIEAIVEAIFLTRSGELALQCIGKHWVGGDHATAYAYSRRMLSLDRKINWAIYAIMALLALTLSGLLNVNPAYLLGLALMIPAQTGYGIYKSLFISAHKLKQQALFEISFTVCLLILGLAGVYFFAIPGLIGALVLSAFFKTVLAREVTRRWWPDGIVNKETVATRETVDMESWLNFGMHSVLRNACASGANQVDILILNAVQGAEAVAVYKIAKTLSSLPIRAAGPLWSALRPRMMRAWHSRERRQMRRLVVLPSLLMFGALTLSTPLIWHLADDLIVKLYGKAYAPATLPFIVLLAGSWIFSAMTAWFVFWVIISEARIAGTLVYGLLFSLTTITGLIWGGGSPQAMATVVSASMITASLACWFIFFRGLKYMNQAPTDRNAPAKG